MLSGEWLGSDSDEKKVGVFKKIEKNKKNMTEEKEIEKHLTTIEHCVERLRTYDIFGGTEIYLPLENFYEVSSDMKMLEKSIIELIRAYEKIIGKMEKEFYEDQIRLYP